MKKKTDKRKFNSAPTKPPGEKKEPLTFYVKAKNKAMIKAKIEPVVKRLDK